MECSCVYVENDGQFDFHTAIIRKAIKEHKCTECRRTIMVGEKYENFSGMFDGMFDRNKTCLDCISVRKAFFCNGWTFEAIWDDLRCDILDWCGEVSESCMESLTPLARGMVCELIESAWEYCEDD